MVTKLEPNKRYYIDIDSYENVANLADYFPARVRKTNQIVTYRKNHVFEFDKEYHDRNLFRWSTRFTTDNIVEIGKFLTPVDEEMSHINIYINLFAGE